MPLSSSSALETLDLPPSAAGVPMLLTLLPVAYIAVVTIPLVVFDIRQRRLPNRLVLPGIPLALIGCAAGSVPLDTQLASRAVVVLATILLVGLARAAHVLGMGDVKLAVLLVATLAPVAFRPDTTPRLWVLLLALTVTSLTAGTAALCHPASPLRSRPPSRYRLPSRSALRRVAPVPVPAALQRVDSVAIVPAAASRSEADLLGLTQSARPKEAASRIFPTHSIPLGPFLLLGFWTAQAASLLPPSGPL